MLCLYLKAPFAAFRSFTAGSYRPTAPFITPSAAYGLALNVAGIESRFDDGKSPMTLTRPDLPAIKLALGALKFPEGQSLYQQLHNYPVGNTGKERAPAGKGGKYNIQPIRREFLAEIEAYVCLDNNPEFEEQVRTGLREGVRFKRDNRVRYGMLFLGDNNYLVDILREESSLKPTYWYCQISRQSLTGPVSGTCRLTINIDRADSSRTTSDLFAPIEVPSHNIPDDAWVDISQTSPTIRAT